MVVMVPKWSRTKGLQKLLDFVKDFIFLRVAGWEPEVLWLDPGKSVCPVLFPADKSWLSSTSPATMPVELLSRQQQRTVVSPGSSML